jgi:hypothetical protein
MADITERRQNQADVMPIFEMQTPDGRNFQVDAPDMQTAASSLDHLPAQPSVAADVAKSGGIGLVKGGIGLAGMSGDIREAVSSGLAKASQLLPSGYQVEPGTVSNVLRHAPITGPLMGGPTSQTIRGGVEGVTGPLYEPKTTLGKYAQTTGEFLPALIGGPETLATKALTRVAAPALASEAAGQFTEGTAAEPFVRPAAALGASVLAHKTVAPSSAARATTAADLEAAKNQNYADVHAMGLELKPQPMSSLATQIEQKLIAEGVTPRNAKSIYDALDTFKNPPPGAVITSHNFDNLRKEMIAATRTADGNMRTGGRIVARELDDYLANLPASHVIKGDAQAAAAKFKEARENFKGMKRMQIAEGKEALGELNASTAHSGQNVDNSMRQAYKQMIRPDKYGKTLAQKEGFNAQETAAINQLARGGVVNNTLRWAGKLAPTDFVKVAGHAALAHGTAGATIPLSLASFAAKKIADRTTLNRTERLLDMIASRTPAGQQQAAINARIPPRLSAGQTGLLSAILSASQPSRGLLPFDQSAY